jgi:hypothetical protein
MHIRILFSFPEESWVNPRALVAFRGEIGCMYNSSNLPADRRLKEGGEMAGNKKIYGIE